MLTKLCNNGYFVSAMDDRRFWDPGISEEITSTDARTPQSLNGKLRRAKHGAARRKVKDGRVRSSADQRDIGGGSEMATVWLW